MSIPYRYYSYNIFVIFSYNFFLYFKIWQLIDMIIFFSLFNPYFI